MTSQHLQQDLFNTTSYQEDSPAKTSQLQGDRKASRRLQGLVSSTNSSESYAWFDQNTSSWRTYQRSLITDWTLFSQSFTRQGTMQNGQLFQRALLELPIRETDFGLLPTPTTMDHLPQRSPEALKKQMEGARKGRTSLSNLREAVNPETQEMFNSLLPTPRASDIEGGTIKDAQFKDGSFYRENKKGEKFGIKLRDAITLLPTPRAAHGMKMRLSENMAKLKHKKYLETEIAAEIHENLPTPSAREWKNGSADSTKNCKKQDQLGRVIHHLTDPQLPTPTACNDSSYYDNSPNKDKRHSKGLATEIIDNQLPTPTASEHKARMKDTTQAGKCLSAMARQDKLSAQNGGDMFLNPAFVEEMMGYEVGWTDLKH